MPLDSSLVGTTVGPVEAEVDARWAMAYAAGIEDYLPCYLDTRRPHGIVTHPVFPVCFEWPATYALSARLRQSSLAPAEAARGVHATYDLTLHRPIRPPERLTTMLTLAGVQRLRPGAYQLMRFETVDAGGRPVCTTWYGSIYRGVEVAGPDRPAVDTPALPPAGADQLAHRVCRRRVDHLRSVQRLRQPCDPRRLRGPRRLTGAAADGSFGKGGFVRRNDPLCDHGAQRGERPGRRRRGERARRGAEEHQPIHAE